MRRRIIAVLLSLSVGVAAMPMPVMAEGGSEVVLEAVEEAAAEAEPVEEAAAEAEPVEEAAAEAEAPVVEAEAEAAPAEEEESVEAADELLIIDEEATAVEESSVETEAPADDEAVIEEEATGGEAGQEFAAEPNKLTYDVMVDGHKVYGAYPADSDLTTGNVTTELVGVTMVYDPFNPGPVEPAMTFKYDGSPLVKDKDYTVEYSETAYKVSNSAELTIKFDSNSDYANLADWTFQYKITPYALTRAKIEAKYKEEEPYVYNGEIQYPKDLTIVLRVDGKERTLTPGIDFDLFATDGSELKDAGVYTNLLLRGKGNFTGEFNLGNDVEYAIADAEVKGNIILGEDPLTYYRDAYYNDFPATGEDDISGLKGAIWWDITHNVKDKLKKVGTEYLTIDPEMYTIKIDGALVTSGTGITEKMLEPGEHEYTISILDGYPNYEEGILNGKIIIKDRSSLKDIYDRMKIGKALENLEYNGKDQSSTVRKVIKDKYDEFNRLNAYDREISVDTHGEMKDAKDYTVTISAAADSGAGDAWSEPYDATVTIGRRQMADQNQMGKAAAGFTITVTQQKFSNDTYSDPVTTIKDSKLGGTLDKNYTDGSDKRDLTEGDFDVEYEYKDGAVSGEVVKALVNGEGNYKSTTILNGNKERDVQIIVEDAIVHPNLVINQKVNLGNSKYITAVVDTAKKNLNYSGDPIKFEVNDIVVTENADGTLIPVPTSEYYIYGYDYEKDKNGNWVTGKGTPDAPKAAGNHTVWIKARPGSEHYEGEVAVSYTIAGVEFSSLYTLATEVLEQEALKQVELPTPKVAYAVDPDKTLSTEKYHYGYYKVEGGKIVGQELPTRNIGGKDLISFPEVGTYRLVVSPVRNTAAMEGITGVLESKDFQVVARNIDKYNSVIKVTANPNRIVWPGRTVTVDDIDNLEVKDVGLPVTNVLVRGKDYEAKLIDGDKIGKADVEISGMNNYGGKHIYKDKVEIQRRSFTYEGDGWHTVVKVSYLPYSGGDKIEFKTEDQIAKYVEVYLENADGKTIKVDPSEYTVETRLLWPYNGFEVDCFVNLIIKARKTEGTHYDGQITQPNVRIVAANIGDDSIFEVKGVEDKVYNGSAQTQAEIKLVDIRTGKEVKSPDCWVVEGYANNTNVGTASVTLKAVDGTGYTGQRTVNFRIAERGLNAELVVTPTSETSLVYDGTAKTKESGAITVTVRDDQGEVVDEGAYVLSYSEDPVNVGEVKVIATAKQDSTYAGKAEGSFMITQAENDVTASVEKVEVGKTTKVAVTAKGSGDITYSSSNAAVATVTTDGTVTGVSAGTAVITVSVAADRNYKAKSTTVTVTVTQKVAGKVTASGVKKVFKTKKQSFTISATALGNAPISFKSDNKNITVNATTGKVTVKAGYVGTANITITAAETANYKKATKTVKVTIVPKATTLKSVTSKNGKITAKWAKKNIATCYQLQYATDKNFTKNKGKVWSKSETATSKTIKKTFTKGKTYYVRIRTCTRTDKSELLYSAWSAAKKVTIK